MAFRRFMDFQEWREFAKAIIAGIFGGLVVAGWQLSYQILSNSSALIRILVPSILTLMFFFLLIVFLRWLFLKKEETPINNLTTSLETIKDKKTNFNEKSLLLWKDAGRDEYLSRRIEWTSVDNKLSSLLIVILAIIGLTIQYINFQELVSIHQYFYGASIILFLISLISCIYGLFPDNLNIINFEHNKDNSYKKELMVLRNQYKKAIENQDKKINKKLFLFKICTIAFFLGVFFILLIKLGVTF